MRIFTFSPYLPTLAYILYILLAVITKKKLLMGFNVNCTEEFFCILSISVVFVFLVSGGRKAAIGCHGGLELEELGSHHHRKEEEEGLGEEWRERAEQELQEKAEWRKRDIQALR